jgi:hypothetical protein
MGLQGQLPDDSYSVAALLDPFLNHDIANASRDNVKSTLTKAAMILSYAGQLDAERIASEPLPSCLNDFVLNRGHRSRSCRLRRVVETF